MWPGVDLADAHTQMGDTAQALAHYDQALRIKEHIGDRYGAAVSCFNLGLLCRDLGQKEQARAHYKKTQALFEMGGVPHHAQRVAAALRQL